MPTRSYDSVTIHKSVTNIWRSVILSDTCSQRRGSKEPARCAYLIDDGVLDGGNCCGIDDILRVYKISNAISYKASSMRSATSWWSDCWSSIHPMKGYSFTPAQSRPSSLISSSERTEQRGGHIDYGRDYEGCQGSNSCNHRSGGGMGKGRLKLASWARSLAAREIWRWLDHQARETRDVSSRTVAITARRARLVKATAYLGGHCG